MNATYSEIYNFWSIKSFIRLFLLWLAGAGTRLTILATPPIISDIHHDLNLTETQVGIISGLPAVLFAGTAILGSLLIARTSAIKTLIIGLLITSLGSAFRGAANDIIIMYTATMITGLGVAFMQPALPSIVKDWFPKHIVIATAIYVNGLLLGGEVIPVAVTKSILLPMLGSWRLTYVFWAAITLIIAIFIYQLAPKNKHETISINKNTKWVPEWNNIILWKLGLMMGCVNATYFATNFFIPRYLHEANFEDLTSISLVALNLGQIPASIILMMTRATVAKLRYPYLISGIGLIASFISIMYFGTEYIIISSAFIGFFSAIVLILMLGLPSMISEPHEVHRSTSLMLTIGYTCAVITPVISGLSWDISGNPSYVFLPMMICSIILFISAIKRPIVNKVIKNKT
ncbi:MFS transporter [Photorhabdus sp. HUG-39]|uniref:MFS transporter n=1 Tax=Photorhabdus kayaii TaxID=230088 RepID=A0ABX0B460_9GAMM|nr:MULTISPECIES: MFS transporter [Photorhabdus]MCC8376508.1 MFS transporter [Photorhabdus bodei]NDL14455.1 MFS transporter [Photorhabdus kayaii]NDL27937.1 MFS transporter [Photorhabdus kayaii]RAX06431.1 MFS transporter [Photorhabdus sp. HUG-39]